MDGPKYLNKQRSYVILKIIYKVPGTSNKNKVKIKYY